MRLGAHQGPGMSIWKRFFVIKLIFKLALLSVLVPIEAYSQALPTPQPQRVNRAVSGALQSGMRSRGFAANDPRYFQTVARAGASATAVGVGAGAAAITAGAITAPAWVSVAVVAGVGALVTYAVSLAVDGLVDWLFREDGTVDESSDAPPIQSNTGMVQGGAYCKVSFVSSPHNIQLAGGDCEALARQGFSQYIAVASPNNNTTPTCYTGSNGVSCGPIYATKQTSGAPATCPAGTLYRQGACTGFSYLLPPVASAVAVSIPTAVSHIPASDLEKPLNPEIVAAIANQAWRQAASEPGYDGLPYPQNDPITAAEVEPWLQANPELAPTVQDFVTPNPVTPSNPTPWLLPSNPTAPVASPATPTNPSTVNPAQENPLTNLGADPAIGAPQLEAIPTAQQILDPVLNMLPSYKTYAATTQTGACPTPTINLYGSHVMNAHCILIDQNKSVIQGAMTFAWAVIALFIVLSA